MKYCAGCKTKAKCKEANKCLKTKKMAVGGAALKKAPTNAKGLKKLPSAVRNKMGYMSKGGKVTKKK